MESDAVEIAPQAAETVLVNGQLYTGDQKNSRAEAIAIKDGVIIYVGSTKGIDPFINKQTKVIDLEGKFAMPSFVESHLHPLSTAYDRLFKAALHDFSSIEEYLKAIRDFAEAHPGRKGIMGSGFSRTLFDAVGPRKELLDAIDSTRPIGIVSSDIHSMWVNSKALEMMGITKDTPDPNGGVIARDPVTGEASGLLQEDAAMQLAWDLFPQASKKDYKTALLWMQKWLNAKGITTAHDAWMEFDPNFYQAYDELAKAGKLTVRFRGSWFVDPNAEYREEIEYGLELSEKFTHPHFQVHSFKFLADNILEEETALLLEPYTHRASFYGIANWKQDDMVDAFAMIDEAGNQIHVHVIGDAAAKNTLDGFEQVREKKENRHSLAHVQLIRAEDVQRMATFGVTAHMSQTWMVMNEDYDTVYLPYLGAKRANSTYPQKSMFDAGVNVTVASDLPTSEPDVMLAIYSGITRLGENGEQLPPASECVSLEQMLRAATINGAYANFLEEEVGSLEVGKKADIVVLSKNLLNIDIEEIPEVEIKMTFFEGLRVH